MKACKLLGCSITTTQAEGIENRIRKIAPNTPAMRTDYRELLSCINGFDEVHTRCRYVSSSAPEGIKNIDGGEHRGIVSAVDIEVAIQRIQEQLYGLSEERKQAVDILAPFDSMDHTGDGTVTYMQFITALHRLGIVAPFEDLQAVACKCSASSFDSYAPVRCMVNYRKFVEIMDTDTALAYALRAQLHQALVRGYNAWACFQQFDRNETGYVSRLNFRQICISTIGLRMRESEMRRLMDKFSSSNDSMKLQKGNRVSYTQFLQFVDPNGSTVVHSTISGLEAKVRASVRKAALWYNKKEGISDFECRRGFRFFKSAE